MSETQQLELNFVKANQERNIGILLAEYGAGNKWSDKAYVLLREFVKYTYKETFLAEEIRSWCYEHGLDRPKNERAFGGVVCRAQKAGVIAFAGYEKTTNVKAHRTPACVWKRIE